MNTFKVKILQRKDLDETIAAVKVKHLSDHGHFKTGTESSFPFYRKDGRRGWATNADELCVPENEVYITLRSMPRKYNGDDEKVKEAYKTEWKIATCSTEEPLQDDELRVMGEQIFGNTKETTMQLDKKDKTIISQSSMERATSIVTSMMDHGWNGSDGKALSPDNLLTTLKALHSDIYDMVVEKASQ